MLKKIIQNSFILFGVSFLTILITVFINIVLKVDVEFTEKNIFLYVVSLKQSLLKGVIFFLILYAISFLFSYSAIKQRSDLIKYILIFNSIIIAVIFIFL